jgi:hypothetical protein
MPSGTVESFLGAFTAASLEASHMLNVEVAGRLQVFLDAFAMTQSEVGRRILETNYFATQLLF